MKPTIIDVAKKANVSSGAASEIINSKRHYKFSPETVARVMKVAGDLGYSVNHFAKSLRTKKTGLIGMVCQSRPELGAFYEPYIADVYHGVGKFIESRDMHLIFRQMPVEVDLEDTDMAQTQMVDGYIVLLYSHNIQKFVENYREHMVKTGIPLVMVHSMDRGYNLPGVGVDCYAAGRKAVRHLLDHGHETIGVAHTGWHPHIGRFFQGYSDEMQDAGITPDPRFDYLIKSLGTSYGISLAERMLDSGEPLPQAIVFADDTLAFGFMDRMEKAGKRFPEDIAVTGFGDWVQQEYYLSDLTSVRQPGREKGQAAAEMLCALIEGKKVETTNILEPQLTVRTSCGC